MHTTVFLRRGQKFEREGTAPLEADLEPGAQCLSSYTFVNHASGHVAHIQSGLAREKKLNHQEMVREC